MKTIDCFEVVTNTDLTEGRGASVTLARFTKRGDAERAAIGQGVMGSQADVHPVKLELFESFDEYDQKRNSRLRKQALEKLSLDEKIALGLPLEE